MANAALVVHSPFIPHPSDYICSYRCSNLSTGRRHLPSTNALFGPANGATRADRLGLGGIALEWDVYQQNCPSRMMMDRIADKWVLLILGIVEEGPVRFNQLRRQVEGISQKSLTRTLRGLERDGLIKREVIASSPVAVEYSITSLGHTLTQAAEAIRGWAQTHMDDVLAAQRRFDDR